VYTDTYQRQKRNLPCSLKSRQTLKRLQLWWSRAITCMERITLLTLILEIWVWLVTSSRTLRLLRWSLRAWSVEENAGSWCSITLWEESPYRKFTMSLCVRDSLWSSFLRNRDHRLLENMSKMTLKQAQNLKRTLNHPHNTPYYPTSPKTSQSNP